MLSKLKDTLLNPFTKTSKGTNAIIVVIITFAMDFIPVTRNTHLQFWGCWGISGRVCYWAPDPLFFSINMMILLYGLVLGIIGLKEDIKKTKAISAVLLSTALVILMTVIFLKLR